MILNSLRLHNFMSYADAVLDLTGVAVACLCGQNGAGKSALLDAITWCLWENARSSSDELIKLGEKEMWVDITFVHEGERYRARRSRHKTSSRSGTRTVSKGTLELQIFMTDAKLLVTDDNRTQSCPSQSMPSESQHGGDAVSTAVQPSTAELAQSLASAEPEGSWRSLTSGNLRETQATICNLLRMNFDTFVNSVYLRQGKADEFTTRAPADRKQVLAEILGLSYFDRLQEKSKEKSRQLRVRADYLAASITDKAEVERLFQEANLDLQTLRLVLADLGSDVAEVTEALHVIDQKCRQAPLLEQQLRSNRQQAELLRKDIEQLSKQLQEFQSKVQAMESILSQKVEIEQALTRFNALKAENEVFDGSALRLQELTAARLEEQTKLANIRSRLEYDFGALQATLNEMESRIVKLGHDTADGETVEAGFHAYRQLVKEETLLAARQEAFSKLTNRHNELQAIINESRIHLEAEIGQKELKIEELENLVGSQTILLERKTELESTIAILEKSELEFELVEQTGLEIKLKLEKAQQQISDLKRKQAENEEKIRQLHRQNDAGICPLCAATIVDRAAVVDCYRRANLEADNQISALAQDITLLEVERLAMRKRYAQLRAQLEGRQKLDVQIGHFNEKLATIERARESLFTTKDEIEVLKERIERHDFAQLERASSIAIKAEIYKLDFDPVLYANLQAQLRAQRGIENRYGQHNRDVAELHRLMQEVPMLREKRQQLSDQLTSESYGDEMRQALKDLQSQVNELAFDRVRHEQVKKELAELLPGSERFRDLQRALAEEPNLRQSAFSCLEMIADKEEQILLLEQEVDQIEALLNEMPGLTALLGEKQRQMHELALKRDEQIKTVAVTEANVHRLADELALLDARGNELSQLRQEIDDYSFLADAFGKKGIQAVIIENAIPEIEAEANKILSRLSENKMHVGLVTQHKNKSGSINETLDLLIGDEVGTRNYELFSGGEAFKVNFAIRVALSKLLARRSGARLETLIIDEGFGSQDEASRERLVRAIRAIQSDFARILVITHMSDIREMFPIQIKVKKVNGSSRLQFAY